MLKDLPNLSHKLASIKLMLDLEYVVGQRPDNFICTWIYQAINSKQPLAQLLATIREQAQENRAVMMEAIGENILQRIEYHLNIY